MADWRQIQARIRKAKNSPDAPSKLSELYQRTRDAMVAWELGAIEEKAGRNDEAGRWYIISAQRFRRADWKKKAEEALTRLGIELPAPGAEPAPEPQITRAAASEESESVIQIPVLGEISEVTAETDEETVETSSSATDAGADAISAAGGAKKKRRRGRRGGRGRHRKGAATAGTGLPSKAFAESTAPVPADSRPQLSRVDVRSESRVETHYDPRLERLPETHLEEVPPAYVAPSAPRQSSSPASSFRRGSMEHAVPMLPSERTAHGRAGDPALASRLVHLESMLQTTCFQSAAQSRAGGRSSGRSGRLFALGFRSDFVVLRGSVPDAARRYRQSCARLAWQQKPAQRRPGIPRHERPEGKTRGAPRNQRGESIAVLEGPLRDSLDSAR